MPNVKKGARVQVYTTKTKLRLCKSRFLRKAQHSCHSGLRAAVLLATPGRS